MKKLFTICLLACLAFTNNLNAQTSSKGKTEALETLGAVSAMMMYNTYITVGAISDGYDKMYTKEKATTLLTEQVNGMDVIKNSLTKLLNSGFLESEDDKAYVRKAISCTEYLKKEAKGMINYMESNKKSDIEAYDDARNNAWKLIADMLGLK